MGDRLEMVKTYPGCLEATLDDVGVFKALRAPIVFKTLREKLFLLYAVLVSLLATVYAIIKMIQWIG